MSPDPQPHPRDFSPVRVLFPAPTLEVSARSRVAAFLLTFLFSVSLTQAAFGFKLDGSLDKEAISHAYFEGEFARVLPPLEMFRQSYPNPPEEDLIFVYKYLGVIYAADASTRKKAESHMVQLVKMMPTIELADLYISADIQEMFKKVKEDYLKQQKYLREHDPYGRPVKNRDTVGVKDTAKALPPKAKSTRKWMWWAAAGAGAAATTGIVLWVLEESSQEKNGDGINP